MKRAEKSHWVLHGDAIEGEGPEGAFFVALSCDKKV